MKTITEFAAPTLKNAAQKQQELAAAGKTPEELPQALGEALQLEGDKLTYLLAALETVGTKVNDLKRVVVLALNEGEKAPHRSVQKGEKVFVAEYFPPVHQKHPGGRPEHGPGGGKGRDGKRRGKRGDRRGGDRRDDRGPRGAGGARGPKPKTENKPAEGTDPGKQS